MRWLAVGLVLAALVPSEELLRWQDPAIAESSGLVDLGDRLVTTNDSGDAARLFVVDLDGRTVRTVDYGGPGGPGGVDAVDVEALAPAGEGEVWVGDVGDNARVREEIAVHRVRLDAAEGADALVASYRLAYADGRSYDAESLVVGPDGRLLLVTKQLTGGEVWAAPEVLEPDGPNLLERVARVPEVATDAALSSDGRHVLVRGYASAAAYALPDWRRVAAFSLPEQEQGEAIAVGPDGRVLLSSEGVGSAVLEIEVPDLPAAHEAPDSRPAEPEPTASSSAGQSESQAGWWLPGLLGAGALGLGAGVAVLLRRGRRASRDGPAQDRTAQRRPAGGR